MRYQAGRKKDVRKWNFLGCEALPFWKVTKHQHVQEEEVKKDDEPRVGKEHIQACPLQQATSHLQFRALSVMK